MRRLLAHSAFVVLFAGCAAPKATPSDRMAWWREARFGMFVHWGLYAIPAGQWGEKTNHGEWIRTTARIPLAQYNEFQPQWNPTAFDANAWAQLAKTAGMQYLVITSKHHDGFCLWDSQQTDWDVANTPHGQDILGQLKTACDDQGVRFGTYHSIMDWHHPDYLPRRDWEKDRSTAAADFARFERYLHAQVGELVANYQPAVMWFDGEWEPTWTHERGLRLFQHCRALAPNMLVNNRVDVHRAGMQGFSSHKEAVGDFQTPEQEIPATGVPGVDWESCMTMNQHWGWNQHDTQWKSSTTLVRNLIDIASKGGNFLLNIGPRADGSFPPQAIERLTDMGQWMQRCGEAIHGTTASVFPALDFGRCTVRRNGASSTLYLHVFTPPKDGLLHLPGLTNKLRRMRLLNGQGRITSAIQDTTPSPSTTLHLELTQADPHATVIACEIDGAPVVYRAPDVTAAAEQFLDELQVELATDIPNADLRYSLDGSEPNADSPIAGATLRLTNSAELRVAVFAGARRLTPSTRRKFSKVTPLPPVEPVAPNQGLRVAAAKVDWQSIPTDRAKWPSLEQTNVAGLDGPANKSEGTALRYVGFLSAPLREYYRFRLTSDDGSKLWIGGQLVVDHDGLHGPTAKDGGIALQEGLHQFELVWFNRTGDASLALEWAKSGQAFAPLPLAALCH